MTMIAAIRSLQATVNSSSDPSLLMLVSAGISPERSARVSASRDKHGDQEREIVSVRVSRRPEARRERDRRGQLQRLNEQ
jgi:hypothetical protein